ncbi:MAG: cytochrome c3 family protein [Nitrospirota bacterium]
MKTVSLLLVLSLLTAGAAFPSEKHDCSFCHISGGKTPFTLKSPLSALCLECHSDRSGAREHKVDIVPKMKVEKLPLSSGGKITCITCHDQHEKSGFPKLLRERHDELCLSCHLKQRE